MKKKLIASGVTALLAAGALSFGVAAPASAHTPAAYASCEAVTVDAVYYDGTKPGSGEPTIEVENPDYVAGTPGSPAVGYPTITIPNPDYVALADKWNLGGSMTRAVAAVSDAALKAG